MRRISAKYARSGMFLGSPVYDARGKVLFDTGTKLNDDSVKKLNVYGVGEILLDDPRVSDVIVRPIIAPELEAQSAHLLRQLEQETRANQLIAPMLLEELKRPVFSMVKTLFPEIIGEPNAGGCFSLHDYNYIQPTKTAALSMVIGKSVGISMMQLASLGMAAILMNIGYIKIFPDILEKTGSLTDSELQEIQQHSYHGAYLLNESGRVGSDVIKAVLQHHERWDGSGYPAGLKGDEISTFARIIGITDSYYALVSRRPNRKEMLPHEAMEFIMAFSGDLFDPDIVKIFTGQVPIYPSGVTVKLNTGEVGIVSDINTGYIGRPKVRIIYDETGLPLKTPYEIDLRDPSNRQKLVTEILGY